MKLIRTVALAFGLALLLASSLAWGSHCSDGCSSCISEGIAVGWQIRDDCKANGGSDGYCNDRASEAQCGYWECFCSQCDAPPVCNRN